jgi:hypothetical protein
MWPHVFVKIESRAKRKRYDRYGYEKGGIEMTGTQKITADTVIGDVIKMSPKARAVIEKHFGNGCFTCAGMNVESVSFGSMMHNVDPEQIVREVNDALAEDE